MIGVGRRAEGMSPYPIATIFNSRAPRGVSSLTVLPTRPPTSALPTGESIDSLPSAGAASGADTSVYVVCLPEPVSSTSTRLPNPTTSVWTSTSRTSALSSCSRIRRIFVSRCAWSFLASWYSEFSLRSPHSRAVLMRSAISLRLTVSRCSSSACSACCASAVMRTGSLKRSSLVLGGEAAPPFPVVAGGHQRVRHAGAEHELAGVRDEGDGAAGAGHADRRAAPGGQLGLQALPDGGRLGNDDGEAVDGGLHASGAYTNICSCTSGLQRRAQRPAHRQHERHRGENADR